MIHPKPYVIFPTELESRGTKCSADDMTVSGIGCAAVAASAARAVSAFGRERLYVLAGIAGQYDEDLKPGTVVAVTTERLAGPMTEDMVHALSHVPDDIPHRDSMTVTENGEYHLDGMIENMEGASFAAVCNALGVECCEIRAISNKVGEPRRNWQVDTAVRNLSNYLNEKILHS